MRAAELYDSVTKRIIADLEKGVLPWQKPWTVTRSNGIGLMPTNAATGRAYSGINIALLWVAALDAEYPTHGWMTFQQAHQLGASVRKGEKATPVVFTKWLEKENEAGEVEKRPMLRSYYVFNLAQLDKLPSAFQQAPEPVPANPTYADAFKTLRDSGVAVVYRGGKACYIPAIDRIELPPMDAFHTEEAFFQTAFHELTHATGHKDRLNRQFGKRFGDEAYAAEELVAELGSAFLCAQHDIAPGNSSDAAYIDHWLKVLKQDNRAIFQAASHASHAADWVRAQVQRQEEQAEAEKPRYEQELDDAIAF